MLRYVISKTLGPLISNTKYKIIQIKDNNLKVIIRF